MPARREEILGKVDWEPFTNNTVIDPAAFRAELELIHQRGYAVSMGEWQSDADGVAAPILGAGAEIQAALTISGPIQRYTPEIIDDLAARILKATRIISSQMGYTR